MEVSSWQTTTAGEYPPIDLSDGARESDLGRRASGRGVVGETSHLGLAANGSVLLAVAALSPRRRKDFVPGLEDVCPPYKVCRGPPASCKLLKLLIVLGS